MGDAGHGHPLPGQLLHDLQDFPYHLRIKSRGRLIEEENLRVHAESPDNGNSLLLAAGELAGIGIGPIGQIHPLKKLHGLLLSLLFGEFSQLHGRDGHVL